MKKTILIAMFAVLSTSVLANANSLKMDFDGRDAEHNGIQLYLRSVSFDQTIADLEAPAVPKPVNDEDAGLNLNNSILTSIKYAEGKKLGKSVVSSLRKLLVLGTADEKNEFMNSSKYIFPQRFANYGDPSFSELLASLGNKGSETHCWEDNCRTEKVCGDKKEYSRICQAVGAACGVAGNAITDYYTGGTLPSVGMAVGAAAALGCDWTCDSWTCDFDDCHDVKKCDSHCETIHVSDGTDHIDPHTGQIIHS